jgi:hypothetical protein
VSATKAAIANLNIPGTDKDFDKYRRRRKGETMIWKCRAGIQRSNGDRVLIGQKRWRRSRKG